MKELAPVRLIKNAFYDEVTQAYANGADKLQLIELLGRGRAKKGMFEGDLESGELEIGQISGLINDVKPLANVVDEIISEFEQARTELQSDSFSWR